MTAFLSILLFMAAAADPALGTAPSRDSLPGKELLPAPRYPVYMAFRGEMNRRTRTDSLAWIHSIDSASGFMKKFISEELEIDPQMARWANAYAKARPDRLAMLHLNGEARRICGQPEVLERYFPGHWVYLPGSAVTASLPAESETVEVADVTPFLGKGYPDRKSRNHRPLQVLLVRLGPNGERLWYESEYAEVVSVDRARRSIRLRRGIHGCQPLDFAARKSALLPIAGGVWGDRVMWFYNLSSACPRDRNGKQANELYAEEIASWFAPGGRLHAFDGIAFDVNYFEVSKRGARWDVDNNGISDGGWVAGRNCWQEGDITFLQRVRTLLGNHRMLTADAQHAANQQLPTVLDGMESEGLVQHNDMWRGFSRALNTHLYWRGHRRSEIDYRYVVLKVMGADAPDALRMRRFGAAVACCLGAAVTDVSAREYFPEPFRRPGSLGRVKSELIRYAERFAPVISLRSEMLRQRLSAPCCSIAVEGEGIVVRDTARRESVEGDIPQIRLILNEMPLPAGDVVFRVQARLLTASSHQAAEYRVPAILWLKPDSLPTYDSRVQYNDLFSNLYGLFDSDRPEPMCYYFRDLTPCVSNVSMTIRGAASFRIESVEIYAAPDVIMREFDHGFIIANPSLHPVRINPGDFCQRAAGRTVEVPAVDACYVVF